MPRGYEWDDIRRQINLKKHGVDFSDIPGFGWDSAITGSSSRDGEARSNSDMTDGYLGNGLTPEEFAALPPYGEIAGRKLSEVAAIYGEEVASNVIIATDPDCWVPADEEFARARPAIEVDPDIVAAYRASKIKTPRVHP